MKPVHAIYEGGIFRPTEPVELPDPCHVEFEPRVVGGAAASPSLDEVYDVLNRRFNSGQSDVADGSDQRRPESVFDRAQRLASRGQVDAALDLVYDSVDDKLTQGLIGELDEELRALTAADYSTDVLLGVLTATLPARSLLPARARLRADVEHVLRHRAELEPGMLIGL